MVVPFDPLEEVIGHGAEPLEVDVDGGVVPAVGHPVVQDGGPHDLVPHLGLVRGAGQADGGHVHHLGVRLRQADGVGRGRGQGQVGGGHPRGGWWRGGGPFTKLPPATF